MTESRFIARTPRLEKSQDYAFLRSQGLEHIERLARQLWTDYNVHDPGITLLELLCYGITDLGYRTGYDIQDLLTEIDGGVPVNRADFHTARDVLTNNPVSFDDLRKLCIDCDGVRNAWIEKHTGVRYRLDEVARRLVDGRARPGDPTLGGLYDVHVEYDKRLESGRTLHVGLPDNSEGRGRYVGVKDRFGNRGIRFNVAYPLTLKSVSVYAKSGGHVRIQLLAPGGKILADAGPFDVPGKEKSRLALGFEIPAGEGYRLLAAGTSVNLYRDLPLTFPWPGIEAVYQVPHLIYLMSGVHGARNVRAYFFFYDWEIGYAAPPVPASGVPLRRVTVAARAGRAPGSHIPPMEKGVVFRATRDLTLDAVRVYADAAGELVIRLFDSQDVELDRRDVKVEADPEGTRLELGFELGGGRRYRLAASGSGIRLFRWLTAPFPFVLDNVIHISAGVPANSHLYYFFDWQLSYPKQPQPGTVTRDDARLAVLERLHAHRNLCEDFVNVCDLDSEEIAVCADLELATGARVEEVLAEIFYRLEQHVSPEVTFYTIEELLARGKTTDQIFEGPALDHGFIDDEEFARIQRRCEVRTSDVIRILMAVEGVAAVRNISLLSFIDFKLRVQEAWRLALATDRFRAPSFSPELSKIVFYKNDLPYFANSETVAALLQEKRSANLGSKLRGHPRDLPVPAGNFLAPETYYPLQNELPSVYGVGQARLPASRSALRKAQARQLKAYLMFFEQLLANYLSQLAHVRELFSWRPEHTASYFTQEVIGVADSDELYVQERIAQHGSLQEALEEIVETPAVAVERRNRFLEHLIGRFSESFTDYSLLMFGLPGDRQLARTEIIRGQRAFLADYPAVGRDRGRAYDIRSPGREDNLTGFQRRVYRLLGFADVRRRQLAGHRFALEELPGGTWRFFLAGEGGDRLFESRTCDDPAGVEVLLDAALELGGVEANYQPGAGVWELILTCSPEDVRVLGATTSLGALAETLAYFSDHGNAEGFHLVEHILLRKRTTGDPYLPVQLEDSDELLCIPVRDPYSFRVTLVLPSWPWRFQNIAFRRFVEETLRREAPAHVYLKICWISHRQMKSFEQCYEEWAEQLALLSPGLGQCRDTGKPATEAFLSGELPLPPTATAETRAYRNRLERLIDKLHNLDTVYPLARLHDCRQTDGDQPQITLNNTNLGTF